MASNCSAKGLGKMRDSLNLEGLQASKNAESHRLSRSHGVGAPQELSSKLRDAAARRSSACESPHQCERTPRARQEVHCDQERAQPPTTAQEVYGIQAGGGVAIADAAPRGGQSPGGVQRVETMSLESHLQHGHYMKRHGGCGPSNVVMISSIG